jgi:hypothetical protein
MNAPRVSRLTRRCLVVLAALPLVAQASSLRGPHGANPVVRLSVASSTAGFADDVVRYREKLDTVLHKNASTGKEFSAVAYGDTGAAADYEVAVAIDSIAPASADEQARKLGLRDSAYAQMLRRQDRYDSTHASKADGERRISLDDITTAIADATTPAGVRGAHAVANQARPSFTAAEKKMLKEAVFSSRIAGRVQVIRRSDRRIVWRRTYGLAVQFVKQTSETEQVDMLLRTLVGKIRHEFATPFLSDQ